MHNQLAGVHGREQQRGLIALFLLYAQIFVWLILLLCLGQKLLPLKKVNYLIFK